MNNNKMISCPGGDKSQTGVAVAARYPEASIENCGKITDVPASLAANGGSYVIPIWNSHEGEISAAQYVWEHIEDQKISISDLWAKKIEFWFVKKTGAQKHHGKIGSVPVAETQCSGFLEKQKTEFIPYPLTTHAFEAYKNGDELDGVLLAPGQGENEVNFEVASKETANPNNFTSFVRFSSAGNHEVVNGASRLTGVSMRSFGESLGEVEQAFFKNLLEAVKDLSDAPKLLFVFKRTAKVGLLFEGKQLYGSDLLDAEEIEKNTISVIEDAGSIDRSYCEELSTLFLKNFGELTKHDFILHQGVNACLFACPPLGLYTHGYEGDTVAPVVRYFIGQLFEIWDNGAKCSSEQTLFFERYKEAWQESGSNFINFEVVSAINEQK